MRHSRKSHSILPKFRLAVIRPLLQLLDKWRTHQQSRY